MKANNRVMFIFVRIYKTYTVYLPLTIKLYMWGKSEYTLEAEKTRKQ